MTDRSMAGKAHTIHAPGRLWMGSVSRQRQRPTSMLCSCVSNTYTQHSVFSFLCVEHIWTLHIFLGWLNMFLRNNCVWTKYLESNCVLTIGFQTLPFITICFLSERHTFFHTGPLYKSCVWAQFGLDLETWV
jgi:hypothetical protein